MSKGAAYRIGIIRGDGIGPELIDAALRVLEAYAGSLHAELQDEDGGADTYRRTGEALSSEALTRIRDEYDATLKGPVGLPEVRKPDGTEAGVLGGILRTGLDAYANIRPVTSHPGLGMLGDRRIDYVIVRENTEGLYLSRGKGLRTPTAAVDQMMMTRTGVERIVRYAFELAQTRSGAPADGVRRVTCVDKSNVLISFAFFRDIFDEVAARYPDVETEYRYADAAGHDLVVNPEHFDVLVMENFIGDVLSDVGAATVGGLGMCASGNIGDRGAYFEPIHGSAPALAGSDRANPVSQILSLALLLEHLGEATAAQAIRDAVRRALAERRFTYDSMGCPDIGTRGVAEVLCELRP